MRILKSPLTLATGLLLGTALPALAQEICGGVGTGGQWIGGAEATSDIATAPDYQEQMALVLGGNQYVSLFSVSAPTDVRVEAAGRGSGDPLIDLYDSTGAIILSDDDSGGDGAARAESMLQPGTYCLTMKAFDGAPMTGFVRIGRTDQEALTTGVTIPDPGSNGGGVCDASTEATQIGGEVGRAPISVTGSVDETPFWRFTVGTDKPVTITAESNDADPLITLYDGAGTYLTENDDFDGLNSRIDMASPLSAGTYCIAMQALSDTAAPITVTVSEYDPAAAIAALYGRGEAAPPLDGSYPVTDLGTLETRQRIDAQNTSSTTWFRIDLPQAGLILVEAIAAGGNGDPFLVMFDDLGRKIGENDDFGTGYDSQLIAKVNAGTYLIGLKDVNGETNGFVRMVMERYVPAQ